MLAPPWFVEAFTSAYLEVYAHRDEESARREAKGALNLMRFEAGRGRLLDLAAGAGRHAIGFRLLGVPVTCLDLSPELARKCRAHGLSVVRGDMRALPLLDASFGAVVCLFSSFGYFEEETEHQVTMDEIARVLLPGGIVLLDLMDPDTVRYALRPQDVEIVDGKTIEVERELVQDGKRVNKQIRVLRDGATNQVWRESVRLFGYDELEALATRAGLRVLAQYGDYDGRPHASGETRRLIVLGKPRIT
ncbi:MAG: class I SAM-dependent methyltransferase [Planctomycetota bacterium]|jgi:SAM-dependent methyltransferase